MLKGIIITIAVLSAISAIASAAALTALQHKTSEINDDISGICTNAAYSAPVSVSGAEVIKQEISCGFAVMEMFSSWNGSSVTEKSLYEEYGKIVTSTGQSFCDEMNKHFPEYTTTIHKYLKNTELIDLIYDSLSKGVPVPFEWAALYEDKWTLHYSLIIGADIPADKITVANPYGYYEELTVREFLDRTTFEAYENMPLYLKLGFAFHYFEKNTIFTVQ